jgi:hypothetical protein
MFIPYLDYGLRGGFMFFQESRQSVQIVGTKYYIHPGFLELFLNLRDLSHTTPESDYQVGVSVFEALYLAQLPNTLFSAE